MALLKHLKHRFFVSSKIQIHFVDNENECPLISKGLQSLHKDTYTEVLESQYFTLNDYLTLEMS
jgi:hypothetical protein